MVKIIITLGLTGTMLVGAAPAAHAPAHATWSNASVTTHSGVPIHR